MTDLQFLDQIVNNRGIQRREYSKTVGKKIGGDLQKINRTHFSVLHFLVWTKGACLNIQMYMCSSVQMCMSQLAQGVSY